MRIAIYDGILETHVGSSFERALKRRGHEVFNTGKIGHGFKFPAAKANIEHLELAVHQVIDFNADVCFVMRPASLPFSLLTKLQRRGITLVAWLSDDPVLFDLSYGPVVESYDLILHCGNQKVLEFYEARFGRPTGVNFPFWTDHVAFPYIWGEAEPSTDLMFLGNVNDEVRRSRYFKLAKLQSSVRIHGNVGADYSGLSGGYLDGDKEVVASGRTARAALNIPQFFENHRGLETWFSGLGDLGFFEYPSRVIQYMAMGLPTISIIPGAQSFRSYPEMIVAESIEEADEKYLELRDSGGLEKLSQETVARFNKHFSADARVLALESLLASDAWKSLSALEREVWFTTIEPESSSQVFSGTSISNTDEAEAQPFMRLDATKQVVIISNGTESATNNSSVLTELFNGLEVSVKNLDLQAFERSLVPDPAGKCDSALNIGRLTNELPVGPGVLIIADDGIALTKAGAELIAERGLKTVVFAGDETNTASKISRLSENYDLVVTSNNSLYVNQRDRGVENIAFLPTIVHPKFLELLEEKESNEGVAKFSENQATENAFARCFSTDLSQGAVDHEHHFDELAKLSLPELVSTLSSEVSLLSFSGTRAAPRVHRLAAYIVLASKFTFASRVPDLRAIYPFDRATCLVSNPGELATKTALYLSDGQSNGSLNATQRQGRTDLRNAGSRFLEMVEELSSHGANDRQYLSKNEVFELERSNKDNPERGNTVLIIPRVSFAIGAHKDWWFRVRLNGEAVAGSHLSDGQNFLIRNVPRNLLLECELEYLGPNREILRAKAAQATYEAEFTTATFGGAGQFPRVTIINQSH